MVCFLINKISGKKKPRSPDQLARFPAFLRDVEPLLAMPPDAGKHECKERKSTQGGFATTGFR
jgi:hypothetical protein